MSEKHESYSESHSHVRGTSHTLGKGHTTGHSVSYSWSETHWSEQPVGIAPEHLEGFIKDQSLSELRRLARELKAANQPGQEDELRGRLLHEIAVALRMCPEVILERLLKE